MCIKSLALSFTLWPAKCKQTLFICTGKDRYGLFGTPRRMHLPFIFDQLLGFCYYYMLTPVSTARVTQKRGHDVDESFKPSTFS